MDKIFWHRVRKILTEAKVVGDHILHYHKSMKKELLKYRLLLPSQIEVQIHRAEEGGFWAKVKTFPGVVAQGEDILDLIEMVNVAIWDYVEVPARLRQYLVRYKHTPTCVGIFL